MIPWLFSIDMPLVRIYNRLTIKNGSHVAIEWGLARTVIIMIIVMCVEILTVYELAKKKKNVQLQNIQNVRMHPYI